jgi:UDP-2,3-diacylglucosamine pyrophosphatase LpxH
MQHAKWLTRLGAIGYDALILLNACTNFIMTRLGREKISLSKKIKNSVKSAVKYINQFEDICADIAIRNQYDYVVCGHIHQPEIRTIRNNDGEVCYLNSGDWVENLTALEYHEGSWSLYQYTPGLEKEELQQDESGEHFELLNQKEIFSLLMEEIYTQPVVTPAKS